MADPQHTFRALDDSFAFDDEPLRLHSGEMHYFRIPRPYWHDRLSKAKQLGLNAVCTYMPWNLHEPRSGAFDFGGDGGMLDVAAWCKLAGEFGLHVLLRPGPYICAEWDFGGLPGWLLADGHCRIRCDDDAFVDATARYLDAVGEQLAPLTCGHGGPIVMVQIENEYGSYSNDKTYLRKIRSMLDDAGLGFGTLYFTSDGPDELMQSAGTLPDVMTTANFGSKAEQHLTKLKADHPNQPAMCAEYWCGWFDGYGEAHKGSDDPAQLETDVKWMLAHDASFNIYMLHGGTNFGFTSGANYYEDYAPTITSYDYRALLDEAGRPTPKYRAVRKLLTGRADSIESDIAPPITIDVGEFEPAGIAPLMDNLSAPIKSAMPRSMECFGQYLGGAIIYRTSLDGLGTIAGRTLRIVEAHDVAAVFLNGERLAVLDRRSRETEIKLPEHASGGQLDIVVWSLGRVNYGPKILDRKGVTERVELDHVVLSGWEIFPFSMDAEQLKSLKFIDSQETSPAFQKLRFNVDKPGDTYLHLRDVRIGAAWVNGHALGRFWFVGPQQTLFVPGCWLEEGDNELLIFDLYTARYLQPETFAEPVLDEVKTS